MSFVHPSYLWGLIGLLIPIAIHLWSKKDGKTIKIGSIKLLREEDSKQSNSISLNELWLLCLRLLIISLIVLIMAEPLFKRESVNTPISYLVESSLLKHDQVLSLIDSLKADHPVRLLETGFPDISDDLISSKVVSVPNYWQLAKEMEHLRSDSIVIFSSAFATGLQGKRSNVQANIEWVLLNYNEPTTDIIDAKLHGDKVEVLSILNNSQKLSFKKETLPKTSSKIDINSSEDSITILQNDIKDTFHLTSENPIKMLLFYDAKYIDESVYLEATLKSVALYTNRVIEITNKQDSTGLNISDYSHIIWLSDIPLARQDSSRVLLFKEDKLSNSIISEGPRINEFYLTRRLTMDNIINDHITEYLLSWLDLRPDIEEKIASFDKRVVSKEELQPIQGIVEKDSRFVESLSFSKWLWLFLVLLLPVERIIAHLRKQ